MLGSWCSPVTTRLPVMKTAAYASPPRRDHVEVVFDLLDGGHVRRRRRLPGLRHRYSRAEIARAPVAFHHTPPVRTPFDEPIQPARITPIEPASATRAASRRCAAAPARGRRHDPDDRELADFDAEIEGETATTERRLRQAELLQHRREAESVDQAESRRRGRTNVGGLARFRSAPRGPSTRMCRRRPRRSSAQSTARCTRWRRQDDRAPPATG